MAAVSAFVQAPLWNRPDLLNPASLGFCSFVATKSILQVTNFASTRARLKPLLRSKMTQNDFLEQGFDLLLRIERAFFKALGCEAPKRISEWLNVKKNFIWDKSVFNRPRFVYKERPIEDLYRVIRLPSPEKLWKLEPDIFIFGKRPFICPFAKRLERGQVYYIDPQKIPKHMDLHSANALSLELFERARSGAELFDAALLPWPAHSLKGADPRFFFPSLSMNLEEGAWLIWIDQASSYMDETNQAFLAALHRSGFQYAFELSRCGYQTFYFRLVEKRWDATEPPLTFMPKQPKS